MPDESAPHPLTAKPTDLERATPARLKIKGVGHPRLPLHFDFSLRRAVEMPAPIALTHNFGRFMTRKDC